MPAKISAADEARMWASIDKTSDCWRWTGRLDTGGYARISIAGTMTAVHRITYELVHGPIPVGLEIDHLCRNTGCVNPDHLEAVTHRVNVLRGMAPAAQQARWTDCKNGHPLSGSNLVIENGKRRCSICLRASGRIRQRRYRDRLRAAVTRREVERYRRVSRRKTESAE